MVTNTITLTLNFAEFVLTEMNFKIYNFPFQNFIVTTAVKLLGVEKNVNRAIGLIMDIVCSKLVFLARF